MPFETSGSIIETHNSSTMNMSWPKLYRTSIVKFMFSSPLSLLSYHIPYGKETGKNACSLVSRLPFKPVSKFVVTLHSSHRCPINHLTSQYTNSELKAGSHIWKGKISNRVSSSLILHNYYPQAEFGPCPNQLSIHCLAFHTLFSRIRFVIHATFCLKRDIHTLFVSHSFHSTLILLSSILLSFFLLQFKHLRSSTFYSTI